jgi:hypothetical protein
MSTLTRAETPTQSPAGELYLAGVRARVDAPTLASRPLLCRYSRAGEFSVQITSAGELDPSVTIWSARTSSSSSRTFTVIPVARSNPEIIDSAVCTCWPLYSVIDSADPGYDDPPNRDVAWPAPASYGRCVPPDEMLAAQERLPARPFTDPERTLTDAAIMDQMLQRLRRAARSWPAGRTSVEVLEDLPDGCRHWLVVPSVPALGGAEDVTVVGFFGDQRPGMNHAALYQLEADVVAGLGRYAAVGLLGYYDAEIAPAVHGNLVLFGTREVPPQWHRDRVHAAAVASAPHHYRVVRLHRGMIRGALLGEGQLVIRQTRYFDFGQQPAWHGLRRFG